MSKTLFLAAFMVLAGFGAAQAQQTLSPADVAAMGGQVPGLTAPQSSAGGSDLADPNQAAPTVYLKGAPINMRPGAYRDHVVSNNGGELVAVPSATTQPGRISYPDAGAARPTSVQSYNAGLAQSRAARTQQSTSVIPSPFPEGW